MIGISKTHRMKGDDASRDGGGVRIEPLERRTMFAGGADVATAYDAPAAGAAPAAYEFDLHHAVHDERSGGAFDDAWVSPIPAADSSLTSGQVVVSSATTDPVVTGTYVAAGGWGAARAAQETVPAAGAAPRPPGDRGKGHVLVVEDDDGSRTALAAVLRRRGWQVTTADSVADGMAKLAATRPDGLVVDLNLPDGDGAQLVRKVREAGLATRVAVTTGVSDAARLRRLDPLAPDAVLRKPVSIARLLQVMPRHDDAPTVAAAA